MKKFLIITGLALALAGCDEHKIPYVAQKTPNENVSGIRDFGIVEGCSVKYVMFNGSFPNIYIVKCPGHETTMTYYETGSKSKTRVPVALVE